MPTPTGGIPRCCASVDGNESAGGVSIHEDGAASAWACKTFTDQACDGSLGPQPANAGLAGAAADAATACHQLLEEQLGRAQRQLAATHQRALAALRASMQEAQHRQRAWPCQAPPAAAQEAADGQALQQVPPQPRAAVAPCLSERPRNLADRGARPLAVPAAVSEDPPRTPTLEVHSFYTEATQNSLAQRSIRRSVTSALEGARLQRQQSRHLRSLFVNTDAMKEHIRHNIAKPVYNVHELYKTTGFPQSIARKLWFEQLTLLVIALNAVWIGIDTQYNKKDVLMEANPEYIAMETIFSVYFIAELVIRFLAFELKISAIKDVWFVFDAALVVMMLAETWAVAIVGHVFVKRALDPLTLRVIRLLRLTRMARMARIFRAVPELMIMMKGLVAGIRPVTVTLFILTMVIYVFGLIFTQLARGTGIGAVYFGGVGESMATLLVHGVFLEEIPTVFRDVGGENWMYGALLLLFVLVGSFLVVNLLVGVLVETVRVVSMCENEEMAVARVRSKLTALLDRVMEQDADAGAGCYSISKKEFWELLQIPEAVVCLRDLGVDVVGLVDLGHCVFDENPRLDVAAFLELVLQLRGSNQATVKDVVYLVHFLREEFDVLRSMVEQSAHRW